jgi:hypothetical protein
VTEVAPVVVGAMTLEDFDAKRSFGARSWPRTRGLGSKATALSARTQIVPRAGPLAMYVALRKDGRTIPR